MRSSSRISAMLAPMIALMSGGAVLSGSQQSSYDKLVGQLPGSDGKTRRSKTKPDRPTKRRNMRHVSRRVKSKHRKAA